MAAQLFLLPFRPAIGLNNLIVAGARLNFYYSGTLTRANIYTDNTLTIPLPNPLVANAAGVWPEVFFDTTNTYRVVLTDAMGVTLGDADPYLPSVIDGLNPDVLAVVQNAGTAAGQAGVARDQAQAAQANAELVSTIVLNVTGSNLNNVTVDTPANGFQDKRTYRFTSPFTSTSGPLTINNRPVVDVNGQQITTAGVLHVNGDVTVVFQLNASIFRLVSSANTRFDDLKNQIDSLNVAGFRNDIDLTRDPYLALTQSIARNAFGTISFANRTRNRISPTLVIASIGNSHMVGQGATNISLCPGEQLKAKLQALLPLYSVQHDNYGTPGSWGSQLQGQIDSFTRTPDIVIVGDPMNDGTANIFMGYEGFVGPNNTRGGYEAALEDTFSRLQSMGCAVINLTTHQPHPARSKASGRFTVTPEVNMTWPVASFIGYFVTFTYTTTNQRITSNVAGLFNTYSNGLLGVGSYLLEFDPNNGNIIATHQITAIDPAGTWVQVNGTITSNHSSVGGLRQGKFDNETEVFPPLTTVNGIGAIVQRDLSGTGALVDVSWRHWELNKLNRRVAARKGVVTVDWDRLFGVNILTSSDYDLWFPNGDDYHSTPAYPLLSTPLNNLAKDIVNGTLTSGRRYA